MLSLRRVLFPVDLSEACSFTALDVARIVRHFDSELTLLHVIQMVPPWYGELAVESFLEMVDADTIIRDRRRTLDTCLQHPSELLHARRILMRGDPATVITNLARQEEIDLVMMPTHGSGAIHRMLLGSVTAKVLRDAECAVWVDARRTSLGPVPETRGIVLCSIEARPEDVQVIQWAARYAASWRTDLKLLHVIPGNAGARHADDARDALCELQKQAGTNVEAFVRGGNVPDTVRQMACIEHAELIAIGAGSQREPLGRLRTTAYGIISKAPCPVVRV